MITVKKVNKEISNFLIFFRGWFIRWRLWKDVHLQILMFISHSKRNTIFWGWADFDSNSLTQKPLSIIQECVVVLHVLVLGSLSNDHFTKNIEFSILFHYNFITNVWKIGDTGFCVFLSLCSVKRLSVCFWNTNLTLSFIQVYEFIKVLTSNYGEQGIAQYGYTDYTLHIDWSIYTL